MAYYKIKWSIFIRHNFFKRQVSLRKRVKHFLPIHREALGKDHCPQMMDPSGEFYVKLFVKDSYASNWKAL